MILCLGEFAGQRERLKPIGSVCFPLGNLQRKYVLLFSSLFQLRWIHYLPIKEGNFIHGSCKRITIQLQHRLQMQIVNMCTVGKKLRFTLMYVATQMAKIGTLGRFHHRPQYIGILDKKSPFVFKTVWCTISIWAK